MKSLLTRSVGRPILAAAACHVALLLPAHAAVFPESIGDFKCGQPLTPATPDAALYSEFGFQQAEQVTCSSGSRQFTALAWRMRDSTGALALFQALRPADAAPATVTDMAAQIGPDGLLIATANYVIRFAGRIPTKEEVDALAGKLPQTEHSALPTLAGVLPAEDLIPNSQRYVLGPVSLERFEPRISPSLAAFSLGAEAQMGRYRTPSGEMTMAIFSYPTPSIARERQTEFLKLPSALAKRAGPLVAVIVQAPNADDAERVLARVQYQAGVSWSPIDSEGGGTDMGNLIVTGILLAGVIVGASLLAGIWLGGFRALLWKLGWKREPEGFTVLRIHDK